jgi:hypothetical protein
VIAGSFGAVAGELAAGLAGLEELAFELSMLFPEFVLTDDTHSLLLTAQLLGASESFTGDIFCSRYYSAVVLQALWKGELMPI